MDPGQQPSNDRILADVAAAADLVERARAAAPATRALLVAISGIDASGKGHVARALEVLLAARHLRVANLGVDGWLHLPARRFDPRDPAEHFYAHAIRFDEMFEQLVLPLRNMRSVRVETDHAEETALAYRRHLHTHTEIDVILLEGIFLLKREYASLHDLSVWVECGFETALERALARGQEGLDREATIHAYRTIYFPAQRIHLERDDPRAAATALLPNDPRLMPDSR